MKRSASQGRSGGGGDGFDPPLGAPEKPTSLTVVAAEAWDRIVPFLLAQKILSPVDRIALELLCESYAEWVSAMKLIDEHGRTQDVRTQHGVVIRPHPAVAMASDAWRRFSAMAGEFGMSPASRSRVGNVIPMEGGGDPLEELIGRGERKRLPPPTTGQ